MKTILVAHYPEEDLYKRKRAIDKAIAKFKHGFVDARRDARRNPDTELQKAKDLMRHLKHPIHNLSKIQLLERYDEAMDIKNGYWTVSDLGIQYMTTRNPLGEWSSWNFVEESDALEDREGNYLTSLMVRDLGTYSSYLIHGIASERNWRNETIEKWDDAIYTFILRQARNNNMLTLIEVDEKDSRKN